MDKGTAVPLAQSNTIPTPRSKDKTTPPSSGGQYGDPPSKYGPIRWMYDPTHYGMGFTIVALTLRPSKPTKAMTPRLGIMATSSTSNKRTNDLGMATNSCTMPRGD